jgi:beta-glucosidase
VEGGPAANDWSRRRDAPPVGQGCAFFAHLEEDLDRAASLGLDAFRFSIEWARIEPRPGRRDPEGLAAYERVVDGCLARGLRPLATLVQFTLPAWCAPRRLAWTRPAVQEAFAAHAAFLGERLGDRVGVWTTFNEPNVQAGAGYVGGVFPPGIRLRPDLADRALVGLLDAHARAYRALHGAVAQAHPGRTVAVGASQHLLAVRPSRWDALGLVARSLERWNWGFLEALTRGELDLATVRRRAPHLRGTLDFVGVNAFAGLRASLPDALRFAGLLPKRPRAGESDMGWGIDPAGFERTLREAWRRCGLPLLVTENGVADADDRLRPDYLRSHLAAVARARAAGVDLRGYVHWSLIDNYEWHEGYGPRFGLFAVDRRTLARSPRASAGLYRRLVAQARALEVA